MNNNLSGINKANVNFHLNEFRQGNLHLWKLTTTKVCE